MADEWIPIAPFKNLDLILGIINYIKLNKLNVRPVPNVFANLSTYSLTQTSNLTGVSEDTIVNIAKDFCNSKSAFAIGGGYASSAQDDYKTVVAN